MKRLVLCAFALAAATAQAQIFDLGRALDIGKKALQAKEAARELNTEEEIALGEGITAGVLGAAPLHADANLQRYVNRTGKWLALHTERAELPWSFGVIDTETVNAFAMPGGAILVSSGLVKRLANESELAAVLAHEIAHVLKKHHLMAIQSSAGASFWTDIGKDLASERIARSGGGYLEQTAKGKLAGLGIDVVKNGVFLRPLDRSMEYEADRMAAVIAARGGYDPYGLVGVMQMLAQTKGENDGASIFSTHPPAGERIAELEKFLPTLDRYAGQPQLEGRFKQIVGR